jgi:two-component system, sensor histidine kinase PdtaS
MKTPSFIDKALNNGTHSELSFNQIAQIRISNAISLIGSLFALFYAIILFSFTEYRLALNDVLFIANTLLLYLFNRFRLYKLGTLLAFFTIPIALMLVNYEYGRIGTEYYFYSGIVLCFYYYKKPVNQYLNVAYFVILILLIKWLEKGVVPIGLAASISPFVLISNIVMSIFLLLLTISLFIDEHEKYQHAIEEKNIHLNTALTELQKKNHQVNMMLKELNHRVKNNLQLISSLFNIQSYKTKNSETKNALKDARNRIVSIAIMHQKLYKENLFEEVMLKKYIEDLVEYLVQSVDQEGNTKVKMQIDEVQLRIEDTVHVGLIINELITNAIKYGTHPDTGSNKIELQLTNQPGNLYIRVADHGKGFPKDFDPLRSGSFGLELVENIVAQHEGSLKIYGDKGTTVELNLKITEFRDS